jgi:hypothetical protein
MKQHWPRWIYASMSKHFNTEMTGTGLKVFLEGTDRDTDDLGLEHVEFRQDGPRIRELNANEYWVWVAINILFKSSMDGTNFHNKYVMAGKVVEAFSDTITLFKLGDGPDDDDSAFGCMVLQDRPNGIQVNHFGQIEQSLRVEQGTVEAHYIAYLTETN